MMENNAVLTPKGVYDNIDIEKVNELKRAYTQARKEANKRYDRKTYKQFNFYLRVEEDRDIIESLTKAREERGLSGREWLRELFEKGD